VHRWLGTEEMEFIVDRLAIGSYKDALHPSPEVTALLNVAAERDVETQLLYQKVPIADMKPIPPEQLKEAVEWIRDHIDAYTIRVFCNAGVGRSPSVVIGYLCCFRGFGFDNAVVLVTKRKSEVSILPRLIQSIEDVKRSITEPVLTEKGPWK
jgi:protein-tyrosine phosphatase